MGKKIALGATTGTVNSAIIAQPLTLEEKVCILTRQVEELTKTFNSINNIRIKDKRQQEIYNEFQLHHANKDGIPIGLSLVGVSMRGGVHVLTVAADGYYIGTARYESLSSSAEASSGVRRSGWTYWKLPDGRTAKEAFGKL
jgi:hypothetical protein